MTVVGPGKIEDGFGQHRFLRRRQRFEIENPQAFLSLFYAGCQIGIHWLLVANGSKFWCVPCLISPRVYGQLTG